MVDAYGGDDFPEGMFTGSHPFTNLAWAYASWVNDQQISVLVSPPPDTPPGDKEADVFFCGNFFAPSEWGWEACIVEVDFAVAASEEPATVIGISPSLGPAGGSVTVFIAGTGFPSNPAVMAPGITVTVNNSNSSGIQATFAIPVGMKGGNVSVTVSGATGSANFYVQIPTTLVRQTYTGDPPAGAPGGYGPLETPVGGAIVNAAGAVLAQPRCGVFRNVTYLLVDQADPPHVIQDLTVTLTESFSEFSGTPPQPDTLKVSVLLQNCPGGIGSDRCEADILDIQSMAPDNGTCLNVDQNQTFTQGFSVAVGETNFPLTMINKVSKRNFGGVLKDDITITKP